MLSELSIKNFAIIDSISLSFDDGFTVLTGETGRESRSSSMPSSF